METNPQLLLAAARCYECNGANLEMLQLMKLGLLKQLVDGGNVMTDPQSLLTAAKCYQCYASNSYMLELLELGLLAQLAGGGGGLGGAIQVLHGNGDPNVLGVIPPDPTKAAYYYDDQRLLPNFNWDVAHQTWW